MSAYNSVNGEFCGDNRELLTDILRDEWGFQGFVISDWIFGIRDAARSVAAGLDVEMPYRMVRADGLRDALKREDVTWEQIDRSIERVLSTLLRFDEVLQQPKPDYRRPRVPGAPRSRARSRREVGRPPPQRAGRRRAGAPARGLRR